MARRIPSHAMVVVLFLLVLPAIAEEDEEVQLLREQLTEREDENRVEDPWTVNLFGRPLSVLGQYEIALEHLDRVALGDPDNRASRLLLEQELELESFYSFGTWLSLFAQFRLAWEEDLDCGTPDAVSDIFVERGEMWLFSENVGGLPFNLEIGRLDFEDDRLWWWDEDLDAVRITYEVETFEVALAVAHELFPTRTDRSFIEPENNKVLRLIMETSWDWNPNHALQFFTLFNDDCSETEREDDIFRTELEDLSDAQLVWVGLRAAGAFDFKERGVLGYWLDAAGVFGDEKLLETEEISSQQSEVQEVFSRNVHGWGFDAGVTYLFPVALDPRITFAYALGSGDKNVDDGTDCSFRQTGLQGNEPGFGGVQRFQGYGELLDPELSNLQVVTVGIGCSFFKWSSADLVFHDYRLVERADSLRDARLDTELTGDHRALGQGVDLVLAFEEWKRFEIEISGSVFRPGPAFGGDEGNWVFGGAIAFRFAF